jgi:hypothetical protein
MNHKGTCKFSYKHFGPLPKMTNTNGCNVQQELTKLCHHQVNEYASNFMSTQFSVALKHGSFILHMSCVCTDWLPRHQSSSKLAFMFV